MKLRNQLLFELSHLPWEDFYPQSNKSSQVQIFIEKISFLVSNNSVHLKNCKLQSYLLSFQCLCCQVRIKHLKPVVSDLGKKGSNEWQRILPLRSLEIPCPSWMYISSAPRFYSSHRAAHGSPVSLYPWETFTHCNQLFLPSNLEILLFFNKLLGKSIENKPFAMTGMSTTLLIPSFGWIN